jgi:hypothetical protein
MKSIFNLAAAVFTFTFLLSNMSVYGGIKLNPSEKRTTYTMKFYRTDTVLVVVPDSFKLTETGKNDIESYVYFEKKQNKPVYVYKPESEVNAKDMKKHILIYGSLCCFQRKEFLRIPVEKTLEGFKFQGQKFEQPNDAFYYVNERATRLYLCKNSKQIQSEIFSIGIGNYPLHVFRGNEIVLTGVYL